MTIVDFFNKLSVILGEYRIKPSIENRELLVKLTQEAKSSGLEININIEDLMSQALDNEFDEIKSYDSYEDDEEFSYDEDDEDVAENNS